ncbi:hypothetical protein [Robertmurraya massiliosenegalensis]|uniref:hypothetical protein n=1 Tax=Robertmurraya massiliosenegalensis TaxID=1287657 RepID=UPI0002FF1AC3|nr:hypothetical protein [Robertmurraya massiliosenegalensis]
MIIFDIVVDLFLAVYTSLGFGTKEYKINTKIEKLGKEYPEVLELYHQHQKKFETDDSLSTLVLKLNLKNPCEKRTFVSTIHEQFNLNK